jgi:hypothetical protein
MTRQQGKRATMRDYEQSVVSGPRCPECGKYRYLTKSEAKRAARRIKGRIGRLNAYRCGDFFHLGHLPGGVIQGRNTRNDLERRDA